MRLLAPILDRHGVRASETLYVGDSLSRDVVMAQRAGVVDVWAEYGQLHQSEYYEFLTKITYWSEAEVVAERESQRSIDPVRPTHRIGSFSGLLEISR